MFTTICKSWNFDCLFHNLMSISETTLNGLPLGKTHARRQRRRWVTFGNEHTSIEPRRGKNNPCPHCRNRTQNARFPPNTTSVARMMSLSEWRQLYTLLSENRTCGISAGFRTVCPVGTCLSLDECFAMSASGSSSFSLAFEISSSQYVLCLASDDVSSCNGLINTVINPFTFANGSSPVPAPNFKIAEMREAR